MQLPTEPAEPTYTITVDARNEAAERWYWQADEADLIRTLASARDLARDLTTARSTWPRPRSQPRSRRGRSAPSANRCGSSLCRVLQSPG